MDFQYPSRRKDPHFTQALLSAVEFLQSAFTTKRSEVAYLDLVRRTSASRFYYGVDEIPQLAALIRKNYSGKEIDDLIDASDRLLRGDFGHASTHFEAELKIVDDHFPWVEGQDRDVFPRSGFLDTLARAYALTTDPKIARYFAKIIADFLRECPVPRDATFRTEHGVWHPLTAAIRIFSWAPAFIGFLGADEWPAAEKLAMIQSFHQHGCYIREHHAGHGNHALMQMRALLLIALLFPEFRESPDWRQYALAQFPPLVGENVYPDGVQFEGSPGYHVVVMRDLFAIIPLLRRCQIEVPKTILEPLERMFDVLLHLTTPDLDLPAFGDTGTAKGGANRELPLEKIMAIGALLFQRPDFKYLAPAEFPLTYLWNFGPQELQGYRDLTPRIPEKTATCFPIGGYMISRENWTDAQAKYLIMRAGVGIGGHCHSDALSIIARAYGKDLIVDAGKGVYEWNAPRKYLLSTRAHNTVVVDGQDQHVRNFHWGPPPSAPCQIWDFRSNERFDFFFASHYGYTRFDDPVIHTRKVLYLKNRYWLIVDLLDAKEEHRHELYFHLPIGDVVANENRSLVGTAAKHGNILIARIENAALETEITDSQIYLDGRFQPNSAVKYSQTTPGPAYFATVLVPFAEHQPEIVIKPLSASIAGQAASLHEVTALGITFDGITDHICINHTSIDVSTYLDYNGNPVREPLLDKTTDRVAVEFLGQTHRTDVVLVSSPA